MPALKRKALQFSDLSPHAVQEILELTEAQEQRFMKAFDIAKRALEQCGIWPTVETGCHGSAVGACIQGRQV